MGIAVTRLIIPKQGNGRSECEDACYVVPEGAASDLRTEPVAVVVSDGASESTLAREWAHHLARTMAVGFAQEPEALEGPGIAFSRVLARLGDEWEEWHAAYLRKRMAAGRPVKWFEHPKLAAGAFATALALYVDVPGNMWPGATVVGRQRRRWLTAALGDSCLFQVRNGRLIRRFPMKSAAAFGNSPCLLGSRDRNWAELCARTVFTRGYSEGGDELMLMTDALAAYFIDCADAMSARRFESLVHNLRVFARTDDEPGFEEWVNRQRSAGRLRNDDVTFVHIDFMG
ncbi:hypothetical protein [Kitasatospora sp. NBC_01302]|uniref:hypothetical protein n=1 Tax=Kitasatospora sp. NBC_01302 TaxID=2903575 RepID=UPI002E0F9047|nr:hypothetical protein OG294_29075 [Kitasatospora sp. NBC_01302]